MKRIKNGHHRAMELVDKASEARREGDASHAGVLLREAFLLERQAAQACSVDLEPTRSVLHRSAASLALECGDFREAERLIASALAGEPPDEIADELRELLQQVYSQMLQGRKASSA